MHPRERTFFSLGEPVSGQGEPSSAHIFDRGSVAADSSDDGWLRLRIALDRLPSERGSWALDPDAKRVWSPAAIGIRPAETVVSSRVHADGDEVAGAANPHGDSRGLVPESLTRTIVDLTLPGARALAGVGVSRTRDGIRVDLPIDPAWNIYGLGEKTGWLDKRGRTWTFWNTDQPIHAPQADPLYQSIPVAYLSSAQSTITCFSDSPATQYVDAGESVPSVLRIEAYDDVLDVYLRVDATLASAVTAYTGLTGRMPMPPEWALGFQQCRYSYFPTDRLLEVARRLRDEHLPCDVLYLDIHYMDGYRVFTWHPDRFPAPARMIAELRDLGFHLVAIVDPGVKLDPDYEVFEDGMKIDAFLERPDGTPYVGEVWPGAAVYPDFTRADVRAFWARGHEALFSVGVDGIWNDMNEPADFTGTVKPRTGFTVPDNLVAGESRTSVARVHNAYGLAMGMATREAMRDQRPDERGFLLTRAGYAGIQRYATVWTGDNHSWWEHLAMMIPMQLNLGLSGVAFSGADAGGFQSNASPELYARWFAAACLLPFFRAHTALDTLDHEPWSFGEEVTAAVRGFLELRYRLLPYLVTLFEAATRTGTPVARPLVWEFPLDDRVRNRADSFMLGSALLVAPVREPGVTERSVYLPEGVWIDAWTGVRHEGRTTVAVDAPMDRLPLFVRGGSIVPFEAVRAHTGLRGDRILRLLVAPDDSGNAAGALYADAGEGHAYRNGAFWRASLRARGREVEVVNQEGSGNGVTRFTSVVAVAAGSGFPERGEAVEIASGTTTLEM